MIAAEKSTNFQKQNNVFQSCNDRQTNKVIYRIDWSAKLFAKNLPIILTNFIQEYRKTD